MTHFLAVLVSIVIGAMAAGMYYGRTVKRLEAELARREHGVRILKTELGRMYDRNRSKP